MLNSILDTVNSLLPGKRKTNSVSGWTSFNAVCCPHRGESPDSRGRGGIITNPNGAISYSCFNCNYTANYTPGRHLNYKFRKLLSWLGADDNTVKRLVIDAIRIRELVEPERVEEVKEEIVFNPRPLPAEAQSFLATVEQTVRQDLAGQTVRQDLAATAEPTEQLVATVRPATVDTLGLVFQGILVLAFQDLADTAAPLVQRRLVDTLE